ncbi:MAG: inositol monophosphatase [Candidatus Binatia bacterium]|nr:MAG: inositol monophosphatase [Candidatus Binatia bacterium]
MPTKMQTDVVSLAIDAVRAAGERIRQAWAQARHVEYKGPVDLVTNTDKEAEQIIVARIRSAFPDHVLVAEEASTGLAQRVPSRDEPAWYVDPLDGTVNFVHGVPHFAVSVAFGRGTHIQVGVVYDPMRDELFVAERGGGAFLNGKRVVVSTTNSIHRALLATGFPYDRQQRADYYVAFFRDFVAAAQDVRRFGSAALDLCWVAAGRYDGFWEWRLHAWDVAAGSLIVGEAGGMVSTFTGQPLDLFGDQIVATNPALHAQVCIRLINRLRDPHAQGEP